MARQFLLEIVTPERNFFCGRVEELIFSSITGEMEVMYHTLPMVAVVVPGLITMVQNGRRMEAACSDGFIRVGDKVTLVVQSCNWPYEIDESETNKEIKALNARIKKAQSMKEYKMAKAQLAIQLANLKVKDTKY